MKHVKTITKTPMAAQSDSDLAAISALFSLLLGIVNAFASGFSILVEAIVEFTAAKHPSGR